MHFPFVYNDYIQTENAIGEGINSKKFRQCKVFYTSAMSFRCAIECDEIEGFIYPCAGSYSALCPQQKEMACSGLQFYSFKVFKNTI